MLKKSSHSVESLAPNHGTQPTIDELYRLAKAARGLTLHPYRRRATSHNGGHLSTVRGRGMEFDEVRVYQAGDDVRTIDWRVTARTHQAHTKLYQEERERPVYCIVDYTAGMYFGTKNSFKCVVAARVAAMTAWMAVQQGDRLGGIIFTDHEYFEVKPQNKHRGLMPFLKLLACSELDRFPPQASTQALTQTLKRLRHVVKPGSLIILISDFFSYNEQTDKHLHQLTKHNEVFACRITDPIEHNLPENNYYVVGHDKEHLSIDTTSKSLRESFHQQQSQSCYEVKKRLYHGRIPLIEFSTATDPIKTMQQHFSGKNLMRSGKE